MKLHFANPMGSGDHSSAVAIAYVNAVRDVFQDKKENFDEFLKLVSDFAAKRIDVRGVKARVNQLFKGHKDLILGFNIFMPTEYEISLPLDDNDEQEGYGLAFINAKAHGLVFKDAKAYIDAVRVAFEDRREKYAEFLEVLSDYKAERIDIQGVKARLVELFKGHEDLILGFNTFFTKEYETSLPLDDDEQKGDELAFKDATAYVDAVKVVFKDKSKEYNEFLKVVSDYRAERIDLRGVKARVEYLFKGHKDLILGFNIFLPKEYQITLPFEFETGEDVKNVAKNCELPWDVLDIISKRIDFDDLFQFACVCKNWRAFHKIYWRNFLAFQEPLIVQKSSHVKKCFSFISIPDQKVYHSKKINYFWHFAYSGSSSGYLIMTGKNNSFLLMNPFTRRKMVINTSAFKVNVSDFAYRVLLAFGKDSEDFVLVALCKSSESLHVYQSRNFGWVTYTTMENPWKVVDFVVLHNTIYVVTDKANIGVLSLNSANIKFLELKSTPRVTSSSHLRLVSCDEQLLVIHITSGAVLNVYKIDFSTMDYVKLETLGDIALFYTSGENYCALSNPSRWGYESNSLYAINLSSTKCSVYLGDDNKLPKCIRPDRLQNPPRTGPYLLDWCFRHLHYEVDYSLVE
ncbi:uncharacterized protein [Cicer arietinum]|uniref:Uncharacterized protein LOC101488742 n=1 Tax=Cicer arietinum TaxID=3827 RepID=A0A1S2XZ63_CICAR|nr:uncharacterized protein LOC101488742 [Cicer arietinum]XP_004496807.1 uncharacterized protein LOC101488742 [Cicer arietinum]XP_004496808.1 uncharacterized protein LOC101488742 [Cicer arietinum]